MTYTKFGWNKASLTACNFSKNGQFYLNFLSKKPLPIFLIKVFELFILWKNLPWKCSFFSKIWRSIIFYWVVVWYHFWPVLRYLRVLSKKFSFVTLVNISKSYENLNVKSSLKLKDLWKLYGLFCKSCRTLQGLGLWNCICSFKDIAQSCYHPKAFVCK